MAEFFSSPAPVFSLALNGTPVGLVQNFQEQVQTEVRPIRAIGQNTPVAMHPGANSYTVRLTHLLLDETRLAALGSPHTLHHFQCSLSGAGRAVTYTDCEFTSLTVHGATDSTFEELSFRAAGRMVREV